MMLSSKGLYESGPSNTTFDSDKRRRQDSVPTMTQRVVVLAIDSSEHSEYAFDWYVHFLHRPENYVMLVHIPEGFDGDKLEKESCKSSGKIKQEMEIRHSKLTELEERYHHKMSLHNVEGRILSIPNKTPGPCIVEAAKSQQAFAVVMGTRGLSKLKKALLGSVSDYVVQNAEVPVIVVRKHHP